MALTVAACLWVERTARRYFPNARVRPYIVESEHVPGSIIPLSGRDNIFADMLAQKPDDGFSPDKWMAWGGSSAGKCGIAYLGGNRGYTYQLCGEQTIFHELLHLWDEGHGNANINGVPLEYRDQTTHLGRRPRAGLNAINYDRLGLMHRLVSGNDGGDILLGCLETAEVARHPDEAQAIKVAGVTLSRRKIRGYPECVKDYLQNTVFAHWEIPERKSLTGGLNVGWEPTEIRGYLVRQLWNNRNHAMIRITRS